MKELTTVRKMILVSLFAALTAIGAFISIPIPYVPFTLQFLFCAFSGVLLGAKLGFLSQLLYVLIGLAGVPVFTKGGGIGYVFQPTFGYLLGFIAAGFIIGKIMEKQNKISFAKVFISSLIGLGVVYILGVPYLYFALKYFAGTPISWAATIKAGFIVCVGGDIVTCAIVGIISPAVLKGLKAAGIRTYKQIEKEV
ncbi:biotin transporter BioY [Oceanirhabdus sp. W0125-5]|uniref:biotin transporter BioY n=1 Tax=Oceanirhabdus sp. W0125-5 TaxID=2999116 RepID=UPI0022F32ED9|nr:biotin transporter BioY [Oceanirhabdus sp. W0125-5]WBW99515.1 biotin transporter BioY [Oceanirhabdus sp. W0125-5]